MKLSVACLASSIPGSFLPTGPMAGAAALAQVRVYTATISDLDDDDAPTTIHVPTFERAAAAIVQRS